jgi:hypothetical protein
MIQMDAALDEIRKIRDENSLRHISQTPEEWKREEEEVIKRVSALMGKHINVIRAGSK